MGGGVGLRGRYGIEPGGGKENQADGTHQDGDDPGKDDEVALYSYWAPVIIERNGQAVQECEVELQDSNRGGYVADGFWTPFRYHHRQANPEAQLIQTISRVNRKFENKQKGLVVDYGDPEADEPGMASTRN